MSDNSEFMTCPVCRGAKFMMKLGGIYGECNICRGSGKTKQEKLIPPTQDVAAVIFNEPIIEDIKEIEETIKETETKQKFKPKKGRFDDNTMAKRK